MGFHSRTWLEKIMVGSATEKKRNKNETLHQIHGKHSLQTGCKRGTE